MGIFTSLADWTKDKSLRFKRHLRATTSFVSVLPGEEQKKKGSMEAMISEVRGYQGDWIVIVIAVLAKVAKCDGVVTPAAVASAEEMFGFLELSQEARQEAIKVFNRAKNSSMPLFYTLLGIRDVCKPDEQTVAILTVYSFQMAHANGELTSKGQDALFTICDVFGLSYEYYEKIYKGNQAFRRFKKESYDILGCAPSDSDDVIKERYRVLVKDFHPDTIHSKGLAPEFMKFAEEKFKRIQAAYEAVLQDKARPKA